jgi:hypothetical protein
VPIRERDIGSDDTPSALNKFRDPICANLLQAVYHLRSGLAHGIEKELSQATVANLD